MKKQFRGFRLPRHLDRALQAAAKATQTDRTKVLIKILEAAQASGILPHAPSPSDPRQLPITFIHPHK